VSRLTGISNVWGIIREINVGELREQAEQPIRIALIGASDIRHALVQLLFEQHQRFAGDYMAVEEYEMPLPRESTPSLRRCDLVVLLVNNTSVDADVAATADQIQAAGVPGIAVLVGTDAMARRMNLRHTPEIVLVQVPNFDADTLAQRVAPAVLERLPDDQRIAAARTIPALRDAQRLRQVGGQHRGPRRRPGERGRGQRRRLHPQARPERRTGQAAGADDPRDHPAAPLPA